MKRLVITAAIAASVLGGCSSLTNGNSYTPTQTNGNTLSSSKVQLAVGTATLPDGSTGLNVVSTFRQSNGLSAALVNTPSIAGPPGFLVPASALAGNGAGGSGTDAGTNSITALPQSYLPGPATSTTFGTVGGDFASGLADFNNDTATSSAYYPGQASGPSPSWGMPFYMATVPYSGTLPSGTTSVGPQPYLVGPPAVAFFDDGTYPQNFAGYMTGFTAFKAAPVAGAYKLTDTVATSNAGTSTFSAGATLTSIANPLPSLPAPAFASDNAGGGTVTVNVPNDPRIVETLVYVVDVQSSGHNLYYTSAPLKGTGTLTFTLPDGLGVCTVFVPGCQNSHPGKTITSGDQYLVYAASFDYPQFEAEPPGNTSQTPTLTGANGQADLTLSPVLSGTY